MECADGTRCYAAAAYARIPCGPTQLFRGGIQSIPWLHTPLFPGGLRCYSVTAREIFRGETRLDSFGLRSYSVAAHEVFRGNIIRPYSGAVCAAIRWRRTRGDIRPDSLAAHVCIP